MSAWCNGVDSYQSDAVRIRARAAFDGDDGDLGALLMYRELEERLEGVVRAAVLMRGQEGLEDVAALLLMEDGEVRRRWGSAVAGALAERAAAAWIRETGWRRLGEVDVAEAAAVLGERLGGRFPEAGLEDAIVAVLAERGVVSEDRRTVTGLRLNY